MFAGSRHAVGNVVLKAVETQSAHFFGEVKPLAHVAISFVVYFTMLSQ
jgi:hypothetical protein